MDQLASNTQWLFDNMPRARYTAHGVRQNEGVKIAAGLCLIPASDMARANREVTFGDFFSVGCQPVVTTGIVATQRRIHATIDGIGQLHPDHRGFQVHIYMDIPNEENNFIARNFYVSWHAIGY